MFIYALGTDEGLLTQLGGLLENDWVSQISWARVNPCQTANTIILLGGVRKSGSDIQ